MLPLGIGVNQVFIGSAKSGGGSASGPGRICDASNVMSFQSHETARDYVNGPMSTSASSTVGNRLNIANMIYGKTHSDDLTLVIGYIGTRSDDLVNHKATLHIVPKDSTQIALHLARYMNGSALGTSPMMTTYSPEGFSTIYAWDTGGGSAYRALSQAWDIGGNLSVINNRGLLTIPNVAKRYNSAFTGTHETAGANPWGPYYRYFLRDACEDFAYHFPPNNYSYGTMMYVEFYNEYRESIHPYLMILGRQSRAWSEAGIKKWRYIDILQVHVINHHRNDLTGASEGDGWISNTTTNSLYAYSSRYFQQTWVDQDQWWS